MSIEGRQLGDRGVEFQHMPAPQTPAPRTVNVRLAVSLAAAVLGVVLMVAAAAGLWGGWAAMFTGGFVLASFALIVGQGT